MKVLNEFQPVLQQCALEEFDEADHPGARSASPGGALRRRCPRALTGHDPRLPSESLRALQPCQRAGSLSAPENLEFRVGEVLGYLGCDRQNCAVRNCGHALDLAVVVANEPYVFD